MIVFHKLCCQEKFFHEKSILDKSRLVEVNEIRKELLHTVSDDL